MKSVIIKLIPESLIDFIRKSKMKLDLFLVTIGGKSRLTADIYYVFRSSFSDEHKAVLQGRKAYYDSLKDIGETCALLRRNTHRLEKGLIMRPRRDVFAEGFIVETVDCYRNAIRSPRLSISEKKWATDVLDEYFCIVGSTRVIDKARAIYIEAKQDFLCKPTGVNVLPSPDSRFKPYAYENLPEIEVSFEDLTQLFIRRRSVRWYQNRPVPRESVQKAANIASLAPSACNRQPYRFVFCNNTKKAIAIASCAGGTAGFVDNLPAIIAVVGDLSAYPHERDRHLIYVDGSLAAMQLMLALETQNLSSCPINWPEVEASERKIRKIIELKGHERVIMLLAVGYAEKDGGIPYSQKKMNNLIMEDISR